MGEKMTESYIQAWKKQKVLFKIKKSSEVKTTKILQVGN